MASFDPQRYISTWAGILIQGPMDGAFFDAEHQEDDVMLHVGAQGFTTYVENANKSGIIKFTLSMKSPTNALLSAAFAAKLKGPWLSKDLDDVTAVEGADVRIKKHAPIKRGKEVIGMEWEWWVPKLVLVAGGDDA